MTSNHRRGKVETPVLLPKATLQQTPTAVVRLLGAVALAAFVYIVVIRLQVAETAPLWLDETWSGMIATRPDWPAFWHEVWLDCNPPFYYIVLALWVGMFGDSNLMLRLPSALFVVGAVILPIVWHPRGLDRRAASIWAALIMLWPMGTTLMFDARGYALILLLSTASCLVVVKLLECLSFKWATAWVALGTMMFLTHYYAAALIIAQSVVVVYRHRMRLLQVWPAALVALPGLAWFVHHAPRLKEYARTDVAWQQPTTAQSTLGHIKYVLGAWDSLTLGIILLILAAALLYRRKQSPGQEIAASAGEQDLALVAGTALIAFSIAILIGVAQASLVNRYLIPIIPPLMLGITLILRRSAYPFLYSMVLVSLFMPVALDATQARTLAEKRAIYGIEKASDFVGAKGPGHVLFLWDHPAAKILDRHSLEQLGSYFAQRQGLAIPLKTLIVRETDDANAIIRSEAPDERTAMIWLFNRADMTSARAHKPSFEADPAWTCRDRGPDSRLNQQIGAVACVKLEKAGA